MSSTTTRSTRTTARRRTRAGITVLAVAFGLVGTACAGGADGAGPATTETPAPTSTSTERTVTTATTPDAPAPTEGSGQVQGSLVLRSDVDLAVHDNPDGTVTRTLPATNEFGSPLAVLVVSGQEGWAEVLLPGRPMGATGWVPVEGAEIRTVDLRVEIDLSDRRLVLVDGDETIVDTAIAVGAPDAPTPTGRFSLTDKIASVDPAGAYGPYALGLSARSEVYSEFAGGDGQIGIHGTDDPTSIGQAVSHGCVRVPNDVVEILNDRLPLGTPVVIS